MAGDEDRETCPLIQAPKSVKKSGGFKKSGRGVKTNKKGLDW